MTDQRGRAHGIGGVFFRSKDPEATRAWYARYLGLKVDAYGTNFAWRRDTADAPVAHTQWSPFKADTEYFGDPAQQFMVNYRVDDLDAVLARLRADGVEPVGPVQAEAYGRFAHVVDADGRRIELWEPVDTAYSRMLDGVTR